MKAASLAELRKELKHRSHDELQELCLKLARFKAENKELLSYLLFEIENEPQYVSSIEAYITQAFSEINTQSSFYIRKSIRKILRVTKKFIRYSSEKETEVLLLLHFCKTMKHFHPSIPHSQAMVSLYQRQVTLIEKKLAALHEDLQYDYSMELSKIKNVMGA
ncbi:MAG: hypothetical protein R2781_03595 [Flavobacteriaceae bacterium]